MARVLVTGANGLLGSTLVPVLQGLGHEVTTLSRTGEGGVRADLRDSTRAIGALDAVSPDVVVNLAALTNVDECERSPTEAYAANTLVVETLAKWSLGRRGEPHLVQLSTDQVYSGPGPHAEEHVRPMNYYALSKYAGELAALRSSSTILRTNMFGRSRCAGRRSLSDWVVDALRNGRPITVFDDVLFNPLSLETLSEVIGIAIAGRRTGIFNVGSRSAMSKAGFAFALAEQLGLQTSTMTRGRSADVPLLAQRPTDMRTRCDKFESRFDVTLPFLEAEIALMKDAYAQP